VGPLSDSFPPLRDLGIIGNQRTAALVDPEGAIVWAPFPRFDSPFLFASLLDPARGGYFRVSPEDPNVESRLSYEPQTNVLRHTFRSPEGALAVLYDYFPVVDSDWVHLAEIHRHLAVLHGRMAFQVQFAPRFGYEARRPLLESSPHGVLARYALETCTLSSRRTWRLMGPEGRAQARFSLGVDEEEWFVLAYGPEEVAPVEAFQAPERLHQTLEYWRRWIRQGHFPSRYREPLKRSALVLKLLFYRPTGAMVAAPTTSLPEQPGGPRNWDYRYSWVRDTALAVRALHSLGFSHEAEDFVYWLVSVLERDRDRLRVLYTVDGNSPPRERTLRGWSGYLKSRPLRVGNAAHEQVQHDLLGNVLEVAWTLERQGRIVSVGLWKELKHLVERACEVWREPDRGIWEVRGPPRHYVYSKVMCWVALDRGLRLGRRLGLTADYGRWRREKRLLYEDIFRHGRTSDGQSWAWYYGAPEPDASLLRLPALGFVAADDPLMEGTVATVEKLLGHGPFLARYRLDDGLPPGEGYFLPCSFWRVEYYILRGELSRARELLDELQRWTSPLELLPEEISADGTYLGNYPQAFSHLAQILAMHRWDLALRAQRLP
jgi:GH15 family glucan-1,4-alpha-glucosidase